MAMTMQGEVTLQTVKTVVRAASNLRAFNCVYERGKTEIYDAAHVAFEALGTKSKSKLIGVCAKLGGTFIRRIIELPDQDVISRRTDRITIKSATHFQRFSPLARIAALFLSMRL